jgi:hypothetical protein
MSSLTTRRSASSCSTSATISAVERANSSGRFVSVSTTGAFAGALVGTFAGAFAGAFVGTFAASAVADA